MPLGARILLIYGAEPDLKAVSEILENCKLQLQRVLNMVSESASIPDCLAHDVEGVILVEYPPKRVGFLQGRPAVEWTTNLLCCREAKKEAPETQKM